MSGAGARMKGEDLVVVTCTLDAARAAANIMSWGQGIARLPMIVVEGQMGVVPAFYEGCLVAWREFRPKIIACLHDDVRIDEMNWSSHVQQFFDDFPDCLLAGFGGARGLGEPWIYEQPFDPFSLVRKDFISNMAQAEQHGRRVRDVTPVACLDGFSLIGRAEFMLAGWHLFRGLGIVHHAYDSAFGALARRWQGETWMLPIPCHHWGGMTAVGDPRYAEWAKGLGGDQQLWREAHAAVWQEFRDVLPFWARDPRSKKGEPEEEG
jgi:hypothetical protein